MREKASKYRPIPPASRSRTSVLAQERVVPADQRLKTILDAATEGHWRWNLATGEVDLSNGWLASLGYSTANLPRHETFLKSIMHADDRSAFEFGLQSHLAANTEALDCQCRLLSKAGEYKWFRLRGKISRRDKSGHPLTMVGAILDIQPQKLASDRLAASHAQLLAILEATQDTIWVVDPVRFELILFNKAIEDLVFRSVGVRLRTGMRLEEIIPSGGVPDWKAFYQKVLAEGTVSWEYKLLSKDETLHIMGHRLVRNGQLDGISVIGHNITEQKRAEAALRKSEEKFAAAFLESPLAYMVTSIRDHRYIEVNEAFEKSTGYTRDEVIGKTPFELGLCPNREQKLKLEQELSTAGHLRNFELEFRTKSGEMRKALGSAALIEIHGEQCMLSVVVDVTESERAAEALRDSEERLRIAIESGPMYASEWDPVADLVQRSEKSSRILGLPIDAVRFTRSEFIERIHPDDKESYLKGIGSLTPDNPNYKLILRYIRPDQKTVLLEESGRAIFEPDGRIHKIVAMTTDVTEARQSERALRELSGRLISSQEEERRRIARELHDHIGQELALLCVQAQRVDSGVSEEEHTTFADVHQLYRRIKEIAVDVSKLSHRLHSSELDFLGLSVAAERLCRDFASQQGLDVDYTIKNVPRLDSGKSLCFYRVLQEALQNVAKHSRATRVVIELRGVGSELVLKIADNGSGFDVERVRFTSGLGLVSIRERLKLVGGRLELSSEEGRGTRLVATVGIPTGSN